MARLLSGSGTISGGATQAELDAFVGTTNIATLGTVGTGTWEGTDVGVAHGGTGASTLTDGGILLGSGTGAITATAVLADSEMLVGDGSADPAIESGSTLRTSIGLGNVNNVADASQTSVGTITSGTWQGTTVAVDQGGTGATTHTANNVLIGAGTSAITSIAPGADGQVLTSTGSVWQSEAVAAAAAGGKVLQVKSAFSDTYATHANTTIDAPANLTDMSVAITPASTDSKIMLMGHIVGSFDNSNSQMLGMLFKRGTTELGEGDASTWTGNTGVGEAFVVGQPDYYNPSTVSGFFVDSPGVDTEITYYLAAFANRFTSVLVNVTFVQGGSGYAYTTDETCVGSCQMIVMEFDPS